MYPGHWGASPGAKGPGAGNESQHKGLRGVREPRTAACDAEGRPLPQPAPFGKKAGGAARPRESCLPSPGPAGLPTPLATLRSHRAGQAATGGVGGAPCDPALSSCQPPWCQPRCYICGARRQAGLQSLLFHAVGASLLETALWAGACPGAHSCSGSAVPKEGQRIRKGSPS